MAVLWIRIFLTIGLVGAWDPWKVNPDDCVCHKYKIPPSGRIPIPFCGYEIIERLTAANQSTANCQADMRYMCKGPLYRGQKISCPSSTPICTPGGPAYYNVLSPERRKAGIDYNSTIIRFCATPEGIKSDIQTLNNLTVTFTS